MPCSATDHSSIKSRKNIVKSLSNRSGGNPIALGFSLIVRMGFIVGVIVIYEILSSDVFHHLVSQVLGNFTSIAGNQKRWITKFGINAMLTESFTRGHGTEKYAC